MLYVFQMVPALLTRKSLSVLNGSLSSFLWRNKRARLNLQKLQSPLRDGGLVLPNIKFYQLACQCYYLWEWFRNDPHSTWLKMEAVPFQPIPLRNVLYVSKKWVSDKAKNNLLIQNTLKVWKMIRKIHFQENSLSLSTPLHMNPDFTPGLKDRDLLLWSIKGICTVDDLVADGTVKSFNQLKEQYDLPTSHFFRYLQIRSFISSQRRLYPNGFSRSPVEEVLKEGEARKLTSRFYKALFPLNQEGSPLKSLWESDLGLTISVEEWEDVWLCSSGCLSTNKVKEMQYKIIHRLQITPMLRHKFNPTFSKFCNKCKVSEGSYFHCIFDCPFIKKFWENVHKEISVILGVNLELKPLSCILGLHSALNLKPHMLKLVDVFLFCARRCILLQWISDKPPKLSQWLQGIMELIPLEAMTYWIKDKPSMFYKIWEPFLDHIGAEKAQTLRRGLYGLIWTDILKETHA